MGLLRPLPAGARFSDPAVLIATWLGVGLLPIAPGTWGALAATGLGALIAWAAGPWAMPVLIAAGVGAFLLGLWAAENYSRATGRGDPSEVVVDEVAAQWLVLAPLPLEPFAYLAGFVLFRVFDVLKPWPVSLAERRLKGGLGVMADDIVAAFYALGCLAVLSYLAEGGPTT